jgi:hypothetical protein
MKVYDEEGVLLLQVKPSDTKTCIRAYLNGANQDIVTGTWTKVNLDAKTFDVNGEFDTATYRFTATKAGCYQVNCAVYYRENLSNASALVAIYKNGAMYARALQGETDTYIKNPTVSDIVNMAVGDYIEMYTYHHDGVNRLVDAETERTFMSIVEVA